MLLCSSYNAHVRFAAAVAVGVAFAARGNREAEEVLNRLTADAVDFVRQGERTPQNPKP